MIAGRRALLSFLFAALLVGPASRLVAASPCRTGPPMACCGGEEGAPAPCSCTLKPAAPAPAVAESASPDVVVAEVPAPVPAPERTVTSPAPGPVTPRARSAPLFVLFAAFLN